MADLTAYYARLRDIKAQLGSKYPEQSLYITSLPDPAGDSNKTGGSVTEVSIDNAAKAILNGQARESTPEEITACIARGQSNKARTNAITQRDHEEILKFVQGGK